MGRDRMGRGILTGLIRLKGFGLNSSEESSQSY
jgi:hypothetical protein